MANFLKELTSKLFRKSIIAVAISKGFMYIASSKYATQP